MRKRGPPIIMSAGFPPGPAPGAEAEGGLGLHPSDRARRGREAAFSRDRFQTQTRMSRNIRYLSTLLDR